MKKYIITEERLLELLKAENRLYCLEWDGVDNWSWYMEGRTRYIAEALGVSEEQVQIQTQYYTDPKYVILSLVVTVILGIVGFMFSNKLIVKHFRKSGVIKQGYEYKI